MILQALEFLCIRYLNWLWGRNQPRPQSPVPWTRNTCYVGFQSFEVPEQKEALPVDSREG